MSIRRRIVRKLGVAVVLGVMVVATGGVVRAEDCWDLMFDAAELASSSCGGTFCNFAFSCTGAYATSSWDCC